VSNYIFLAITILCFSGVYAQEENCPEPKKKAVKYFENARTASFNDKKTLLTEAIKIDPNYLEAYDELANLADKSVERAYNSGNASGIQQYTKIKIDYWNKIVEICPEYRNFFHAMELGNYYFGQRQYAEAKPYFQKIMASPTWQRKAGKSPSGGLNRKGVASYRAANPGSKLKTAVTTKPSKLKAGSKAAKRRKSFCARMTGMRKRQKPSNNTGDDRLSKSLRKWNC